MVLMFALTAGLPQFICNYENLQKSVDSILGQTQRIFPDLPTTEGLKPVLDAIEGKADSVPTLQNEAKLFYNKLYADISNQPLLEFTTTNQMTTMRSKLFSTGTQVSVPNWNV